MTLRLPALVPELLVTDVGKSLDFWCGLVGFEILYDRPEDRFAMLVLGEAAVMLEQRHDDSRWITGPLASPFGRGINLQIDVPAVEPIIDRLAAAGRPLVMDVEDAWYRAGDEELGQRQFCVQDPDGYLLRLVEGLGARRAQAVGEPRTPWRPA